MTILVPGANIDADIAAIAALATTGFLARTGAAAWSTYTLTGTANQISVTNGAGGGNPVFSTPQNIHTAASPTFNGLTLTSLTMAEIDYSGTVTYGAATGTFDSVTTEIYKYLKVGKMVLVAIRFHGNPSGTPTYLTFSLPFAAATGSAQRFPVHIYETGGSLNATSFLEIGSGSSTALVYPDANAATTWATDAGQYLTSNFFYLAGT